jgi:hypothetical protein
MEQEARAETKKQQESELVAEQKSWSWRKKRKPCCSLAQDLEETSYARLFFLYEPVATISAKQQILKASEECVTRLDDDNPSFTA